jgi:hypothetical protein
MSVITDVPRQTPRVKIVVAAVLVLLFLGMSLVAIAKINSDCENDYLTGNGKVLTADDNDTRLTAGPPQYWLIVENVRYPLPMWAQPLFSKFGLLPTECR